MKKIIIVMLLVLFSSQVALARVTDNPIDYGRTPESLGGNLQSALDNTYYVSDRQPKPNSYLTQDVRDLQKQIDELNERNAELELKLLNFKNPVVSAVPQTSVNDAGQTQKIEALEKRVGIIETVTNGLKTSINKTLDLLTKLLSLLK